MATILGLALVTLQCSNSSRCGGEGSEGEGEVHEGARSVADGHYPRPGTGNPAVLELLLLHAVDDVLLLLLALLRHWADDVHLVVLPSLVALVHCDNRILVAQPGCCGCVPEDVSHTAPVYH